MRVFVFTYNRYDSITTSQFLDKEEIAHTVLCHTKEARQKFIEAGRVKAENIIATGKPKGLTHNRNFALDMMTDGEWALFLVDDFIKVTELDEYDEIIGDTIPVDIENNSGWGRKFNRRISFKRFIDRAEESAGLAELQKIYLVGFAGYTNPLFRGKKWKYNTLADGRAWVVRKSDLRFDENVQMIDDVCWTAQNIIKFGGVLVNQWILPECSRYTAGSFGSIKDRLPQRLDECKYLVGNYPGLIRFAKKRNWPYGTHIRIANRKEVNRRFL